MRGVDVLSLGGIYISHKTCPSQSTVAVTFLIMWQSRATMVYVFVCNYNTIMNHCSLVPVSAQPNAVLSGERVEHGRI